MKTLSEYCRGAVWQLCALQAPFHLLCLRLRAELLSELSCWAGWQKYGEVEICSRDACVCVRACARACVIQVQKCTRAEVHNTSRRSAGGFNQFMGAIDKSCLVHVSPPAGPV